jgi:hypothetical protein
MSSHAFHRTPGGHIRQTTAGKRFEPQNLESFDSVTQELYRLLPATIHTQPETKKSNQKSKTPMTQAVSTLRASTALATT